MLPLTIKPGSEHPSVAVDTRTLMIKSCFQSQSNPLPARGQNVRKPEREEKLYDTFLKMRDLLEEYAPSWYSDALRQRVEAIVQHEEQ